MTHDLATAPRPQATQAAPEAHAREADARTAQLHATGATLNAAPPVRRLSARGAALAASAPVQRVAVVQRRTTHAVQRDIANKVADILKWTTPPALTNLDNRITFNAGGVPAARANFGAYRADAEAARSGYSNVLDFALANDFTNYTGDGLDASAVPANHAAIEAVRDANDAAAVSARKNAMIGGVAKPILRDQALDYNGRTLRDATTLVTAQAALDAWETHYFTVPRSKVIEDAKRGARNGAAQGAANATMWATANVGRYPGHMTIYNNRIGRFDDYLVTAATVRGDSDALANEVIPDAYVHETAEVTPWRHGVLNPKIWGNPPRRDDNAHAIPADITWNSFVAPLAGAEDAVRDRVWAHVNSKKTMRP